MLIVRIVKGMGVRYDFIAENVSVIAERASTLKTQEEEQKQGGYGTRSLI